MSVGQDDAANAQWYDILDLPEKLAFDHKLILHDAFTMLAKQPEAQQAGECCLPESVQGRQGLREFGVLCRGHQGCTGGCGHEIERALGRPQGVMHCCVLHARVDVLVMASCR